MKANTSKMQSTNIVSMSNTNTPWILSVVSDAQQKAPTIIVSKCDLIPQDQVLGNLKNGKPSHKLSLLFSSSANNRALFDFQ